MKKSNRRVGLTAFVLRARGFSLLFAAALLAWVPTAQAASGNWNVNASGYWNTPGNWTPAAVPGTTAGDTVGLTYNITAARAVTNDTAVTLGTLNIGDSGSSYYAFTLAAGSGSSLTFDNNGSGASLVQATTTAADIISAPLTLADNLAVNNSGSGGLTLSGTISGAGKSITKSGAGALTLAGTNTYSGGTMVSGGTLKIGCGSVNSGTTITGSPTGLGDVTFAAGTSLDNNNSANSWYVPTITPQGTLNLTGGNRLQVTFKTFELSGGAKVMNVNGVSKVVAGGNTLTSETTGNSQWDMSGTTALGTPVVQNGILDLETTAFSGATYGTMRINNAMNWSAADLVIGSNVLLFAANVGVLGTSAATSPKVTLNGIMTLTAKSVNLKSLSGTGSVFGSMIATNTVASALTLNGASGVTTFSGSINNGPGSGALSLTKNGGAVQVLSGTNTYTGVTAVNGGYLLIDGNSSAVTNAVTVAGGATLGGSGTLGGSVTVNAGGLLSPGGLYGIGTLTLTNTLTLKDSTLVVDLSNTAGVSDRVAVTGAMTYSGATTIILNFPNGPAPAGTYTLISAASVSGSGSIALAGAPYNYSNVTLSISGTNVQLVVGTGGTYAESPFLRWKGNVSSAWDTSTANWTTNGIAAVYAEGRAVIFDDAAANFTVEGSAAPGSLTFDNSFGAYTINAVLSGSCPLVKNGTATASLAGANVYSGDTTVNAGTLAVNAGGTINSPFATLNIPNGTGTLFKGGAILVRSLLATNVVNGSASKSVFTFSGGTLATSNDTGIAANILLASNATWNINGTWNMNAGTNRVASVQTGGTWGTVYVGNAASNASVNVNPGSVWSLGYNTSTNTINLNVTVGSGAGGNNNALVVNNGLVTNATTIMLGNTGGTTGNGLIITNGGLVFLGTGNSGNQSVTVGNSGSYNNGLIVAGQNAAGGKATLNLGGNRLYVGNSTTSTGNWARVDQGGLVTNSLVYIWGFSNSLSIVNGGQVIGQIIPGRSGISDSVVVAGADTAGNKATLAATTLIIGGGGSTSPNPGTNNLMLVGQGGRITASSYAIVGGNFVDTNAVGNGLCITNGGQFISSVAVTVGTSVGCNSNWVYVGGSPGPGTNALLNLGTKAVTIGNDATATGNWMTVASGGIFTNGTIVLGGVGSRLYLDGGKLIARASGALISTNATAVDALLCLRAGGAVIDSAAFTVTNGVAMAEDPASTGGTLTKLGSGMLVLAGTNTYSGQTVVAAGTLTVAGALGANISVQSGATLNGTGTLRWQEGQPVVVSGTLDISQMSLELLTAGILTVGDRVIVDFSAGTLTGAPFANVIGLPPSSRLVYDSVGKKVILRTYRNGTVIRLL